jgi:hypothetical protein
MKSRVQRLVTLVAVASVAFVVIPGLASAHSLRQSTAKGARPLIRISDGLSLSSRPSASAAASGTFSTCQNGGYQLCLWQNAGYEGTLWTFNIWAAGESENNWHYVGGGVNDKASSAYNHRVNATLLAKDWPPGYPDTTCMAPGDAILNMSQWAWPDGTDPLNDSVSSYDMLSSSGCS